MSTIEDKARAARENLASANPSNAAKASPAERKRIPLTLPRSRLAVPEVPGYHLHWFEDKPGRIQAAQDAGYEFVDQEEVNLTDRTIGGDGLKGGNTDLGSRVSTLSAPVGGATDAQGQPMRLYLMKQKLEWYIEDQKILQARNDQIVDSLTVAFREGQVGGRAEGETAQDAAARYVGHGGVRGVKIPELFRRKTGPRS